MLLRSLYVVTLVASAAGSARAEEPERLPDPLRLSDVITVARQHRAEVLAAKARARAAAERPEIVSALEDPMIFPAIDHVPLMGGGADWSVVVEQRFPLSGILGHRRRAAEAQARGSLADAERVQLDVELEAASAFLMLREERQMAAIFAEQKALADQLVTAATVRYGGGKGAQAEVLRAEIEVARLDGEVTAKAADVRAAVAMLNTSIGRPPEISIGELAVPPTEEPPAQQSTVDAALTRRPELRSGQAEIDRARAEVSVMNDMYKPMAMVQTGPASTMTEGEGWMVMVGISIPIWHRKLRAGVSEAKAMTDMAEQDLVAMRRMVIGDAVVARERVIAMRARWIALRDQVVPRAKAAIEPTLAAYTTGQLPLVSVLEAAQTLWEAQMDLASAERRLGEAWARLSRATATGGLP
jgi:cobalt-zinc-cadmium efflux system outer membrane protein